MRTTRLPTPGLRAAGRTPPRLSKKVSGRSSQPQPDFQDQCSHVLRIVGSSVSLIIRISFKFSGGIERQLAVLHLEAIVDPMLSGI